MTEQNKLDELTANESEKSLTIKSYKLIAKSEIVASQDVI